VPAMASAAELDTRNIEIDESGAHSAGVRLTLVPALQREAQRLLVQARAPAGAIVMADVKDGRLLVWASRGSGVDLVLTPMFPPASLLKVVTAAALLEDGHVFRSTPLCYSGGMRDLEWQDVAEFASSRAVCDSRLDAKEAIEWATVAVLVFDRLTEVCQVNSAHYEFDGMSLRAGMVRDYGPEAGHPVLDPALVENWFFRRLKVSLEEAVALWANVAQLPTEVFLRLASLKDRLRVIRPVFLKGLIRRKDDLAKWLTFLKDD